MKNSQFSKKMAAGQRVKEKHLCNTFDGNPGKRNAFHKFCQQWGGQSVVALSFMQGQYHN